MSRKHRTKPYLVGIDDGVNSFTIAAISNMFVLHAFVTHFSIRKCL